jgi:D-arabinose 1-dehydrogenase-like Zn-dependent alcohol dehydrogenase
VLKDTTNYFHLRRLNVGKGHKVGVQVWVALGHMAVKFGFLVPRGNYQAIRHRKADAKLGATLASKLLI